MRKDAIVRVRSALVGLPLLLGAACTDAQGEPVPGEVPETRLESEVRSLSEAETGGPLVYPLGMVAGDSGIWVLDAGAKRVVHLPGAGAAVPVGREGAGPGEFKNPTALHPLPDGRIFVWDAALLRTTELSTSPERPRTTLVPAHVSGLTIKHALPVADGVLAVFDKSADALNAPEGDQGSRGVLAHLPAGSERVDTLATFPLSGPVIVREARGSGFTMQAFSPPFDALPHADRTTACGGFAAVSTGGREFQLRFFGPAAEPLGTLELPLRGPEITPEERERYFAQFPAELHRAHDLKGILRIPERHPAVHAVRLTRSGHLWVRLSPPGGEGSARWRVWPVEQVGRGGIELGEPRDVLLPGRFSVQDTPDDELWGFFYDELDVPTVRAYRLPRLGETCADRDR